MRRGAIITLNLLALVALIAYFLPEEKVRPRFTPPPDFAFTDLQGEDHHLSDFKGKVILLHFWASWCRPCLVEFPELVRLAAKNADKLVVLAVSVDKSEVAIQKFTKSYTLPANFYLIQDKDKAISSKLFQTFHYPETVLIGCDFTLRDKVIGVENNWPLRVAPLLSDCIP